MINLREQGCWLALVFESKLSTRIVNDILVIWCKQLGRTLEAFFEADAQEWRATCQLKEDIIQKLLQAKEKLVAQAFLAEQLQHEQIHMMTVLDSEYPSLLKKALTRNHIPPMLFYAGDLAILKRETAAIIGSRNAGENSLAFTRAVAKYLAHNEMNVISGHARGVDRAAYEGAADSVDGYTTVVLPHGIHKISKVQMREMQAKIEAGKLLLLSQFHPDAPWLVSRAMERNSVVTGLAQVVIVAESDTKGGTWEGANGALKQGRTLYVRRSNGDALPGNHLLLERGAIPLDWPIESIATTLTPLLKTTEKIHLKHREIATPPSQLSLLAIPGE